MYLKNWSLFGLLTWHVYSKRLKEVQCWICRDLALQYESNLNFEQTDEQLFVQQWWLQGAEQTAHVKQDFLTTMHTASDQTS